MVSPRQDGMPRNGLSRKEERMRPTMRELHELPEIVKSGTIRLHSGYKHTMILLGSSICFGGGGGLVSVDKRRGWYRTIFCKDLFYLKNSKSYPDFNNLIEICLLTSELSRM